MTCNRIILAWGFPRCNKPAGHVGECGYVKPVEVTRHVFIQDKLTTVEQCYVCGNGRNHPYHAQ
jgi:hypothetical protein